MRAVAVSAALVTAAVGAWDAHLLIGHLARPLNFLGFAVFLATFIALGVGGFAVAPRVSARQNLYWMAVGFILLPVSAFAWSIAQIAIVDAPESIAGQLGVAAGTGLAIAMVLAGAIIVGGTGATIGYLGLRRLRG